MFSSENTTIKELVLKKFPKKKLSKLLLFVSYNLMPFV